MELRISIRTRVTGSTALVMFIPRWRVVVSLVSNGERNEVVKTQCECQRTLCCVIRLIEEVEKMVGEAWIFLDLWFIYWESLRFWVVPSVMRGKYLFQLARYDKTLLLASNWVRTLGSFYPFNFSKLERLFIHAIHDKGPTVTEALIKDWRNY